MYVYPFFNGQPETGFVGSPGFPTNDERRGDRGNGRNVSKGTGDSTLTIRKVGNVDPFLDSSHCRVFAEINSDSAGSWKELCATVWLEDASRLAVPSEASPTCDGLDNRICGLAFGLQGQGTRLALPSLTVGSR